MADIFISYKREERDRVEVIAEALRALQLDVWFDASLNAGSSFDEEINREVRNARCVLVLWSPGAIGSDWVRAEASIGKARDVLVPAYIEPCELYPPFNLLHTERLEGFAGDRSHVGWRRVVDAIGRKVGRPGLGAYVSAQGATDRLWTWANEWPADPLADAIWDERVARAGEREAARLSEERARLQREGPRPSPSRRGIAVRVDAADHEPIERAPRPHGFVFWVAVVTALLMVGRLLWLMYIGSPGAWLSSLSLPIGAQIMSSIVGVFAAIAVAWVLRLLLPRGAVRLSLGRALMAATVACVALIFATPVIYELAMSLLGGRAPGFSAYIFLGVWAIATAELAAIIAALLFILLLLASPLARWVTRSPPSLRDRAFVALSADSGVVRPPIPKWVRPGIPI